MGHIFISFCDEDTDFAFELSNRIQSQAKLDTWLYKDDSKLRPGAHWKREIDQAIKDCYALVVIVTPAANSSIYVAYEWAMALGLGKPVIPILLKDTRDMHPKLNDIQWEDFRQEKPWGRFIKNLQGQVDAYTAYTIRVPRDAPKLIHNTVALLDEPSPEARKRAIYELARMDHPSISIILVEALHFVAPDVRALAAETLGDRNEASAIPELLKTLKRDKSHEVVSAVVQTLGKLKATKALRPLIAAFDFHPLDENVVGINTRIVHALSKIGGIDALTFLIRVFDDSVNLDPGIAKTYQWNVIMAIAQFGSTAVPYLKCWLHKVADRELHDRILHSLSAIGNTEAINALIQIANQEESQITPAALRYLGDIGKLGNLEAVSALDSLAQQSGWVGEQAKTELKNLQNK